ncbi:MAG: thiopurine S-methyltransferase [Halieaceae bacterium]
MDAEFWLSKWKSKVIGFHLDEVNPLLVEHIAALCLPQYSRIFLPLCGKTRDAGWLLGQGYRVAGCELSEIAVKELFQELGLEPEITRMTHGLHYAAPNIDLFICDIFNLSEDLLGPVDAIYDRAALIALPLETRALYSHHLRSLTQAAPQLLVTVTYDQEQMNGPPFSVTTEEINSHYSDTYDLMLLASSDVPGGLKGRCAALESAWLMQRKKKRVALR